MSRYLLQQSTTEGWWTATDTENGIVVRFREGAFNDTQRVTFLEDVVPDPQRIAVAMRELADWLAKEYYDIAMPLPENIKVRKRIGRELRTARRNLGLTREELSERTGLTASNIYAIEYGRYNVGIDLLHRVAVQLGKRVTIV